MKNCLLLAGVALLTLAGIPQGGRAHGPSAGAAPACEPGYTMVQEVCYDEVVRTVCRRVPGVKKVTRWVYTNKPQTFCTPRICPSKCHDGCGDCGKPACGAPLVKIAIVEECPTTKCVVETVVERVPHVVWHKLPCAAPTPACLRPAPPCAVIGVPPQGGPVLRR